MPAIRNVQTALSSVKLGGKVKVSTVHSMAVLSQSDPPSSGSFNPALRNTLNQLLAFLKDNKSPFTVNPYPFFAYQSDPRPETLAFCLFQPNSGRVDSGNGKLYTNMFDAQVTFPFFIFMLCCLSLSNLLILINCCKTKSLSGSIEETIFLCFITFGITCARVARIRKRLILLLGAHSFSY